MSASSNSTPSEHSVLIVDDEPNIVSALRRELSAAPTGSHKYLIEGFTDPRLALERAREKTFEVVISDFRMPEMDGLEFLNALKAIQPDCVGVVLSGQTDKESLVKMINETQIYRFIPKPWSTYFLKSTMAQAVTFRANSLRNRQLANVLRQKGISLPDDAIDLVDQILVVDDEIDVAQAIARELSNQSRFEEAFSAARNSRPDAPHLPQLNARRLSVQITDSPLHALQMANTINFACVISDYKMPKMDGAKFLDAFSEKQPDAALIMISGVADLDGIVFALDMAHIQSFIAKPWGEYELRSAVAQALAHRRLQLENSLLAKMCDANQLQVPDQ